MKRARALAPIAAAGIALLTLTSCANGGETAQDRFEAWGDDAGLRCFEVRNDATGVISSYACGETDATATLVLFESPAMRESQEFLYQLDDDQRYEARDNWIIYADTKALLDSAYEAVTTP